MTHESVPHAVCFSQLLPGRHPSLYRSLRRCLRRCGVATRLIGGTRDIWCRDYLPVRVGRGRYVQFAYTPDYLRADPGLVTEPSVGLRLCRRLGLRCEQSDIALDGGNVVRHGATAIVTEKVFSENPTHSPARLKQMLAAALRARRLVLIPVEPGDVVGHADGVVRFVDSRTVLVNDYTQANPSYGRALERVLRAAGLRCMRLAYCPSDEVVDGMPSAAGNYVNFLQAGSLIVVPRYSSLQTPRRLTRYSVRSLVPWSKPWIAAGWLVRAAC